MEKEGRNTERGGVESCDVVNHYIYSSGNHRFALPIPYEHQIPLLPSHLQICFFVPNSFTMSKPLQLKEFSSS
ncbi:hypothetical protein Hanom_Chr14g01336511 [Helianthus anomalus]